MPRRSRAHRSRPPTLVVIVLATLLVVAIYEEVVYGLRALGSHTNPNAPRDNPDPGAFLRPF